MLTATCHLPNCLNEKVDADPPAPCRNELLGSDNDELDAYWPLLNLALPAIDLTGRRLEQKAREGVGGSLGEA